MLKSGRYLTALIFFFFISAAQAQLTGRFAVGVGSSPYFQLGTIKTVEGGVGYTFFEELQIYGGAKIFINDTKLIRSEEDRESDEISGETFRLSSLVLQGGIHHTFNIIKFTKNRSQWEYSRIAIFPEINGYFLPLVPHRYKLNGEVSKGPKMSQFAYGIGGGIAFGQWKYYVALKYEINNIDNLASIKTFVEDYQERLDHRKFNHVVSLIFVFK